MVAVLNSGKQVAMKSCQSCSEDLWEEIPVCGEKRLRKSSVWVKECSMAERDLLEKKRAQDIVGGGTMGVS